jgi:L,D-transpeptidase ErfK/SrfK
MAINGGTCVAFALVVVVTVAEPQAPVPGLPPPLDPALTRGAVVGDQAQHVVQAGETFPKLAAWWGVDAKVLAAENNLPLTARLKPGQSLTIPTRHIVPPGSHDGILVNIPQRHLFYFSGGSVVAHYPVAVGRGDWRTPEGGFHVAVKEENPTWNVPKSIQEEMRREGKPVKDKIPPGPDNPLGQYWIGLNRENVGIHGTNNPDSIFRSTTHGCIRMHAKDVKELFAKVPVKTPVTVIYQPVLMAAADDGVYVEAHPDVYRKGGDWGGTLRKISADAGLTEKVDWDAVGQVLAKREGVARLVARVTQLP